MITFVFTFLTTPNLLAKEVEASKYPLSIAAELNNSVGIGSFVSGNRKNSSWTTSLALAPSYLLPKIAGSVNHVLSMEFSLGVQWFDSYGTSSADLARRAQYSDIVVSYNLPKLLYIESVGYFLSPSVALSAPISVLSRAANKALGYGIGFSTGFEFGDFTVAYTPKFSGSLFHTPYMTVDCSSSSFQDTINPSNIDFSLESQMVGVSCPASEVLQNGSRIVPGRQTVAAVSNALSIAWSPGNHKISMMVRWDIGFLRSQQEYAGFDLSSTYASKRSITEITVGMIAYTYKLPIEVDTSFTLGMMSFQPMYAQDGRIRFPFFDFITPSNNLTQLFLTWTIGV